jgi:hypothetical protein
LYTKLILLLLFVPVTLLAQNLPEADWQQYQCGSTFLHNLQQSNSIVFEKQQKIDAAYIQAVQTGYNKSAKQKAANKSYIIPVVVHVMHLPGTPVGMAENISEAQIQEGIKHLNQAFGKQTAAYSGIGHNPNIVGVDTQIQFVLAKQDPNGNPTNGIHRVATPYTSVSFNVQNNEGLLKANTAWNTNKYYNIWLVKEICSNNVCGIAGFANMAAGHGTSTDGIVSIASAFGASANSSKIHIHETGHYLNLYHTFDNFGVSQNNCLLDGDKVCDTPNDASQAGITCGNSVNTGQPDTLDTDMRNPYRSVRLGGLGEQPDNYENYMDYGSRACQTTFTDGQKVRMHHALASVRSSLFDNNQALTPPLTATLLHFADSGITKNESAATQQLANMRKYQDVALPISLYNTAAHDVTVHVTVNELSTATPEADYQLLTNQATIPAGSLHTTVLVRVFDDKIHENNEQIVLNMSSANAQIAAFNHEFVFTIIDNDIQPSGSRQIVYNTNFDNNTAGWLFSSIGSATANICTIGAFGGTCTSGNSLYVTNNNNTKANNYNVIASAPLAYKAIDALAFKGLQLKYDIKVVGKNPNDHAKLLSRNPNGSGSFKLIYGSDSLQNIQCQTGRTVIFGSEYNNTKFDLGFNFVTTASSSNNTAATGMVVDNLEITANPTEIASMVNLSAAEYLGPYATVYFQTETNQVLAKIENLTQHDYGFTTIQIDRAGTTMTNNNGAIKYTSKSLKITPANNNPTGSYKITLFYNDAEIQGWEAATGIDKAEIEVLKASENIASATDANTINAEPILVEPFGDGWAYTTVFHTGFSGFSLGAKVQATALGVQLLSFEGKHGNNSIVLNWKTAQEKDFSHFEIEKSTDSKEFTALATVFAKQQVHYNFTDTQPEGINYYRLKMVDNDGSYRYSAVISVKNNADSPYLLLQNPVQNRSTTITTNLANPIIYIVSATGIHIQLKAQKIQSNTYAVDLTYCNTGTYWLIVQSDKKKLSQKILVW